MTGSTSMLIFLLPIFLATHLPRDAADGHPLTPLNPLALPLPRGAAQTRQAIDMITKRFSLMMTPVQGRVTSGFLDNNEFSARGPGITDPI